MSEKQETLADIVAEMRSIAKPYEAFTHTYELLCGFADRIEAAWKRQEQCYLDQIRDAVNMIGHERFVKEHPSAGNSAAMREALAELVEYLEKESRLYDTAGNIAAFLLKKFNLRAALAAPARNCDLYGGDYKMLHTAWFDWTGSPSGQNPDGTVKLTFAEWLLAPANEKGESDGSK